MDSFTERAERIDTARNLSEWFASAGMLEDAAELAGWADAADFYLTEDIDREWREMMDA